MNDNNIKPGIYLHYKGNKYRVIGTARDRDSLDSFIVYETLYDNPVSKLWLGRPEVFQDDVEVDGKKVKRFQYLGEDCII